MRIGLKVFALFILVGGVLPAGWAEAANTHPVTASDDPRVTELAKEVQAKGWIVYGACTGEGDWDLFVMRPDGSKVRNITNTPTFNEGLPRFGPDGSRILYRRLARNERFDNNRHGMQGVLVVADSDGGRATALGTAGQHPWASWGPQGKRIACLSAQGITIVELATGKEVGRLDRKGFFQQLTWSPDGQWLIGVANSFGTGWSVARMEVLTGRVNAVSTVDCCTPDWFADCENVIFSYRPPGQKGSAYGWTQLWMADSDGDKRRLVYGEDGRHVYGGAVSPDGRYVLFTGNMKEDGDPSKAGAPMGLMRLRETPTIGGTSAALRKVHPRTIDGPVLVLPDGWEPHWTFAQIDPENAP